MTIQTNKRFEHALAGAFQELFGIAHVDKATRDNIRTCYGVPRLFIDGEHHHQNAILCQHLPVTQYNLSNIANAKAIDKNIAAGGMVGHFDRVWRDFNDIAILGYDNVIFWNTQRIGQLRMQDQLTIFTMHGHEEVWTQ